MPLPRVVCDSLFCYTCNLISSLELQNGLKKYVRNVTEIKYGFVWLSNFLFLKVGHNNDADSPNHFLVTFLWKLHFPILNESQFSRSHQARYQFKMHWCYFHLKTLWLLVNGETPCQQKLFQPTFEKEE